jgi:hypothetical protein
MEEWNVIKTADELLMLAASGGRVVCSGDLTEFQIAHAQANGPWYVNESGFGFTVLPWNLTTDKDRMREVGFWSKGKERHDVRCEKFIAMWDGRLADFPAHVRCTCSPASGGS